MNGVQEAAGSNPVTRTTRNALNREVWGIFHNFLKEFEAMRKESSNKSSNIF